MMSCPHSQGTMCLLRQIAYCNCCHRLHSLNADGHAINIWKVISPGNSSNWFGMTLFELRQIATVIHIHAQPLPLDRGQAVSTDGVGGVFRPQMPLKWLAG
ncbi:hypothetical protein CUJ84_pRLN1000242 (plasmid) [Rhizobium leguminosarum]|uniref:Uncharacterized protein n=1 Tax=Rhizobium leguminosarum TaxID=384 RepID=A0A2K9ZBV4_RHILE|nr:hypothetical protein CUJ84_pRLN1000242 [Rhizobium leguminosarum]